MKRLIVFLLLLLLIAPAALASSSAETGIRFAVVSNPDPADRLNLRTQPSTSAISLGKFYNGTPVTVLGMEEGWAYVELYKDFRGWMLMEYLVFDQDVPSAMPIVTVTAPTGKSVHDTMRDTPSVSAPVMMGSQLEVMGVMEDWLFVRWGENIAGFTQNGGVSPRMYFSTPNETPPARLSILSTPAPTAIGTGEYAFVSASVEDARNVTKSDWINFGAPNAETFVYADKALTKPIGVLMPGEFFRVFNGISTCATLVQDGRIAGYLPAGGFTIHASRWPFPVSRQSASVNNPLVSDRLHLREQPDQSARSLGRYYNGTVVTLLDNPDGRMAWTNVDICGIQGYMMSEYLDFSPDLQEQFSCLPLLEVANSAAGSLHLRAAPDTDAESRGLYPNGTLVCVIGVTGDWAHVICGGQTGFMLNKHLRTSMGTAFDPYY